MKPIFYVIASALLLTSACAPDAALLRASPQAATEKPGKPIPTFDTSLSVEMQGNVAFVTGGIGDDERAELEAAKPAFNFHLTSAKLNGEFVEYTMVKILDASNAIALETEAGPLLYANLPAGKYTLIATNDTQEQTRTFTIGKKSADLHVRWK